MKYITIQKVIGLDDKIYYYAYSGYKKYDILSFSQIFDKKGNTINFIIEEECKEFINAFILYNKIILNKNFTLVTI